MSCDLFKYLFRSVTATSAQVLYTLRRPQDVEFPPVSALESAITGLPSQITVTSITRFGKHDMTCFNL